MRSTYLLFMTALGLLLGLSTQALAGHDSSGVNLQADDEVTTMTSSRTGHAPFTASALQAERGKLSNDQREEFDVVAKKLVRYPAVRDQLAALLVKHRLKQRDAEGHTVLDDIALIARSPAVKGIVSVDAAADLVSDICRPSTIAQAQHNTCTATSVQSALARSKPADYAHMVASLVTRGEVTVNGLKLTASGYIPYKDRSVTSNLMQPAIMEAEAQVEGGHYDNRVDKTYPRSGRPYVGAAQRDVCKVEERLLGGHFELVDMGKRRENVKRIRDILRHASAKEPVLAGVSMSGGGGHEIQVVGFDAQSDQYRIRNPWGQVHLVPAGKFEAGVGEVSFRAD